MTGVFAETFGFNQNIDSWNVSSVTNMSFMFRHAASFNQPLNSWNVSWVTNMYRMFFAAGKFNQGLNSWDVSQVTNMGGIFQDATDFNGNIGLWDITSLTSMSSMFRNAPAFNRDISAWDIAGYANENLGNTSPLQNCAAQSTRNNLINNKGWTITDDTYIGTCHSPMVTTQPISKFVCESEAVTYSVTATNTTLYQWQVKTGAGAFANLSNGGVYSGVTSSVLQISNAAGLAGNQYRVIASNPNGNSLSATLSTVPSTLTLINPNDNVSAANAGTLKATDSIVATNKILATGIVRYETAMFIALNPSFSTESEAVFTAKINQNICP